MNTGDIISGKYLIIESVGSGGMGTVVKVQDVNTGEESALKYCNETNEGALRRFSREVRIMQRTVHPNVVRVLDYNLENDPPYFVMPLAIYSLDKAIPKLKGRFEEILPIFDEVCKGIAAMHNAGHYHRDIKPQNVLVMPDGTIAVSDFGLARMITPDSSAHPSSNGFLGTPLYHAPEQIDGKSADARTDVFQLAKTFYQLYTGDYPHLINPAKLTAGLSYIIQTATNPDPNRRYQTVSAFQQALKVYEKSLDPKSNPAFAFESKLNEVKSLAGKNQTDAITTTALLDILALFKDEPKTYLDKFEKIPLSVIRVLSSEMIDVFEPFLDLYTDNLDNFFDNNYYDYAYAEIVTDIMVEVYGTTKKIEVKIKALRNILVAAVRCGRYYAMDRFDEIIKSVKEDAEAMAIKDLLEREMQWYESLFDRVSRNSLHYIIQSAWNHAEEAAKKRREPDADELKNLLNSFNNPDEL